MHYAGQCKQNDKLTWADGAKVEHLLLKRKLTLSLAQCGSRKLA